MRAVKAHTFFAKTLLAIIVPACYVLKFVKYKKWQYAKNNFSEDPLLYNTKDLIYFAYKYFGFPHQKSNIDFDAETFFSEQHIYTLNQDKKENIDNKVTLHIGGDLMPYEWIKPSFCKHLWDDIGDDFFNGDLVFANLETPIVKDKKVSYVPEMMLSNMLFNGSDDMFNIFNGNGHYKGFDVLSTANNHSLDMDAEGVEKTIAFLESKKIKYTGTARSIDEQNAFPIIEKNGIKIAFLAYTYSLNQFKNPIDKPYLSNYIELNKPDVSLELIYNHVKIAKSKGADFIVASLHYGNAYQLFPSKHIIDNTHRVFTECGVDLILGGHPHNIQPMEKYTYNCPFTKQSKTGYVVYSLADFVAYDIFLWCHLPVYIKFEVVKVNNITQLNAIEVVPVYMAGNYKNTQNRDLRLLNAERVWEDLKQHKNSFHLTRAQIKEATALENYYKEGFKKCL